MPSRGLLYAGLVYLVLFLLVVLGLDVLALRDPKNGNAAIAIAGLILAPVAILLLRGILRRLRGDTASPMLSPGAARVIHAAVSLVYAALLVVGMLVTIKHGLSGPPWMTYVTVTVFGVIGILFLVRFLQGARIRWS